jgi:malonate transporter
MIAFFLLSLPIFGVVALGWVAAHTRLASPGTLDAVGAFSFRFALPALVLQLIASRPLSAVFNPIFYGGYLACGASIFVLVFSTSRILGRQAAAAAGAHATASTVSNLGFLGPPLMLTFFGPRGTGPLAMAILSEVMVVLSVGAGIMGTSRGGVSRVSLMLRGTVLNPVVGAIIVGIILAATRVSLPVPLDRLLGFLGGSAAPTALFALGGSLAQRRLDCGTALAAAGLTLAKLVAYPLLAWFIFSHLLHIEAFWVQAGVLLASLPSASSVYVVAHRYAADAERLSAAIVLSTVVSVVTVPLTAWLILR